ncbi:sigma factor-like helix-turn-helix DNA-binding protein [Streptomyces sp. NPDC006527]
MLGVPAGTVKSRHHNALRKLRSVARPEPEAA